MKSMAKAILVGGFMLAAQAAVADDSAFPGSADDGGIHLPANITYASQHANDPVTVVGSAFPGSADDGGIHLPPNITYASQHANDPVTIVGSAFPGSADDAGIHLPPKVTYADRHLDQPVRLSQPAQRADNSAN